MKHKKHLRKAVMSILILLEIPLKTFRRVRKHASELEARSLGLPPDTSWEDARHFFKTGQKKIR